MYKTEQEPRVLLGPVPAALIACGNEREKNIITLAWVGVVCSSPPMISAAVNPSRHSHALIRDTGEFTVNLPTVDQVDLVDGCGTLSGRDINKLEHFKLTPVMGKLRYAPMLEQCPVSMECRVSHTLELGSHTLFIGEVLSTHIARELLDDRGSIDLKRCRLLGFCAGNYLQVDVINRTLGYSRGGRR